MPGRETTRRSWAITGGALCDPFADPAVLDGLIVAEAPGERVEQAAGLADGHVAL
jgi:hypothetical protein